MNEEKDNILNIKIKSILKKTDIEIENYTH